MTMRKLKRRNRGRLLSELPTCIIHHIMSFVEHKDVIRMRTMSKTWMNIFESYPCLVFKEDDYTRKPTSRSLTEAETDEKRDLFRKLVNGTLRRFHEQRLCLTSFQLEMRLINKDYDPARLDEWLEFSITKCDVKDITLCIGWFDSKSPYRLPGILFTSSSLTKLKSRACYFKYSDSMNLGQSSLRTLDLEYVMIDQQAIDNLKYYCPLLENISISECYGFTRFNTDGLNRLRSVKYEWYYHYSPTMSDKKSPQVCATIMLEEPNLEVIELSCNRCQCQFVSIPTISGFDKLKRLKLSGFAWEDEIVQHIISRSSCSLEYLSLTWCDTPKEMLISSSSLKTVEIKDLYNVHKVQFDAPKLSSLTVKGSKMHELFLNDIVSSRRNWCAFFGAIISIHNAWLQRLFTFVSTNQFQDVRLCMYDLQSVSVKEPWVSPDGPCKIRRLEVKYPDGREKLDYIPDILNALFGNFRPLHLCFKFNNYRCVPKSLKLMKRKETPSCWRHFLKGAVVNPHEDARPLVWSYKLLWS